jgi:hypothetical protein
MGVDVARLRAEAGNILAQLESLGPARLGEITTAAPPRVMMTEY